MVKTETAAGRGRRWPWAILSFLFVIGVAVFTTMAHSERNRALDRVVEGARDDAQLVTDNFTGKQLTKPVTGSSYDKLAGKIWKSVSSKGSIVGVTVWSSRGKVLFSLNESRVGNGPAEMRSLITGTAQGSGSARVVDDTVQTFTPVSKASDGPVAVVEIDQPIAVVEAQVGDLWSMLRLGSALGLTVSLLLLGLAFVSSRRLVRAPEAAERPRDEERQEGHEGAEMAAEGQPEEPPTQAPAPTLDEELEGQAAEPPTQAPAPTLDEDLEALEADLDQAVDEDVAPEGDLEPDLESQVWTHWREELQAAAIENGFEPQESPQEWREEAQDVAPEGDSEIQESMRQWREEFKSRAKQAELRLKRSEAELDAAPSAPNSER